MEPIHPDPHLKATSPEETLQLVCRIFRNHFSSISTEFIAVACGEVQRAFAGTYPGYQRCDTAFHDFTHTCQAAVATARIFDGHLKSRRPPALTRRDFELGITGILLHDIGFLKEVGDDSGTGAKYTHVHVDRSISFAEKFLSRLGASPDESRLVQLAIRCTAVDGDMNALAFRDERERFIGSALATGDILGTMAAPDYPERLPSLYREFAEAAACGQLGPGENGRYQNADDLLRRTRDFYQNRVRRMLDQQWRQVYRALEYHFGDGRDHYLPAIDMNLTRIDEILAATQKPQR